MIRWSVFLGYTVFLFVTFTLPADQLPAYAFYVNDKLTHFLDFLLLTLLGFWAFLGSPPSFFSSRGEWKAFSFSLFYGAFLEWVQIGTLTRHGDFQDWVADFLGTVAALGIFYISRLTGLHTHARVTPQKTPPFQGF